MRRAVEDYTYAAAFRLLPFGVLLKYQDDIARVQGSEAARLFEQVRAAVAAA